MATITQQAGRKNFVDFDEFIEFQLKKTRSNIKLTDILTAIAGMTAMVIAYLLVFVVFDHWVIDGGFGNATRWLISFCYRCSGPSREPQASSSYC